MTKPKTQEATLQAPPPPVLLPYQRAWMEDRSSVRVIEKSRRVGITWTQASESALLAASTRGMDTLYIGYEQEMTREFIQDAAFWSRHYKKAASEIQEMVFKDEEKDILAFRIRYASGFEVMALSSRPRNLRGKQGLVVVDEAGFHDDFPGLLKAAMALLIWGGRVAVISTHNGIDNPYNELITEIRAGKKPYSLHRVTFDDALSQGLYKQICLKLGKPWSPEAQALWREEIIAFYGANADEELGCIPSQSAGAYFSRALVENRMDASLPVVRLACPVGFAERPEAERYREVDAWLQETLLPLLEGLNPKARGYYGMDFGRTGDLSVIFPLLEDSKLKRTAPFLVDMRNVPFHQQEQVLFFLVDRLPRFCGGAMDARGNGQYLAEVAMQRYGSHRILQVMLSQDWYRENMPRYHAAYEDAEITLPKDADVLDDHRAVKIDKGVPKVPDNVHTKGSDGLQRHGDSAIAGCLAWHASVAVEAGPVEYQTVLPRRFGGRAEEAKGGPIARRRAEQEAVWAGRNIMGRIRGAY